MQLTGLCVALSTVTVPFGRNIICLALRRAGAAASRQQVRQRLTKYYWKQRLRYLGNAGQADQKRSEHVEAVKLKATVKSEIKSFSDRIM